MSDVARASRRAGVGLRDNVGAEGESALAGTQTPRAIPPSKQPSRAPNLPQPVFLSGNNTVKVRQKADEFDAFMPTPNPPASKKVIEKKDTIG